MNKIPYCLFLFLCFAIRAQAQDCKVGGISDSPQKLHCNLNKKTDLFVSCVQGKYLLKWHSRGHFEERMVEHAYHLEVEEGASPMVFKNGPVMLTIEESPRNTTFRAEFRWNSKVLRGHCI